MIMNYWGWEIVSTLELDLDLCRPSPRLRYQKTDLEWEASNYESEVDLDSEAAADQMAMV